METDSERAVITAMSKLATCPVCGFKLGFLPWGPSGDTASHEICPCCGIEFGYQDDALLADPNDREKVWAERRRGWIEGGMKWYSKRRSPPENWDPIRQLRDARLAQE